MNTPIITEWQLVLVAVDAAKRMHCMAYKCSSQQFPIISRRSKKKKKALLLFFSYWVSVGAYALSRNNLTHTLSHSRSFSEQKHSFVLPLRKKQTNYNTTRLCVFASVNLCWAYLNDWKQTQREKKEKVISVEIREPDKTTWKVKNKNNNSIKKKKNGGGSPGIASRDEEK